MSSATLILALPGAGKTSLLCYLLKTCYKERGKLLLKNCREMLERLNRDRETPFELPDEPPIYADSTIFKVKFKVGYDKWFQPYTIDPSRWGVVMEGEKDTEYILPYGQAFIPEIQRYSDSRKGLNLPTKFSRIFEMRRHFHLEIYMDGHHGNFIDKKVRTMCNRILDLKNQEHERDELGRIIKTRWSCLEYPNYDAYELKSENDVKEIIFENEGNIFKDFDSFGCEREFIPPDGLQFSMAKPKG